MRLSPTHVMLLSLAMHPACGQATEDDAPSDEPVLAIAHDEPELPGPATLDEPVASAATEDDPSDTLDWPLAAVTLDVAADAVDALAPHGDRLIFAGRRGTHGLLVRLASDPKAGTTKAEAERDLGEVGDVITLASAKDEPALATWFDPLGIGWSLLVDEHLADAKPRMILDPELDGQGHGAIVLARDDDGTLACAGVKAGPLRCTMLDRQGASSGWMLVGKSADLQAEALVPSPRGWLLLASSCRAKDAPSCKRIDLAVVRLDHDAQTKKKLPPLSLPQVEARRGGVIVVPIESGLILVARRVGAGEASAWKVGDDGVRELDGKWSRVVGGLESDDGIAFVESAPLGMRQGFPVATFRLRELEGKKRGEPLGWPSAVERLLPRTVDQRVLGGAGLWTFIEPIRKGQVKGTVVRVGRVL